MPTTFGLSQLAEAPPLDFLTFTELTPGSSVGGYHDWTNQSGWALFIKFDPVPVNWGFRIGTVNTYVPRLAEVSFAFTPASGPLSPGVYSRFDVNYGDWLLYPVPTGPLVALAVDVAVNFEPHILGRVWIGAL